MTDRARYWQCLVREQGRSGLTQAAFCRRRNINAGTFAWWRRKLRTETGGESLQTRGTSPEGYTSTRCQPGGTGPKPVRFMEVEVVGSRSTRYEIVLPGGLVLRVSSDFDCEHVTRLIRAVVSAC